MIACVVCDLLLTAALWGTVDRRKRYFFLLGRVWGGISGGEYCGFVSSNIFRAA